MLSHITSRIAAQVGALFNPASLLTDMFAARRPISCRPISCRPITGILRMIG